MISKCAKCPITTNPWLLMSCWNHSYFRPKFLTENGNFIIESAINKNISFRLKGSAFLNVNDMNVMNLLQIEAFNRSNVPNSNLASRISSLEEQIRSSPVAADTPVRGNRRVMQRLSALEARMHDGPSGIADVNITSINRRIRRLEIQFNRITQRLNADNCSPNPCKNGGQCLNTFGGYICKCTESWEGTNCENDVNECANFAGTDLGTYTRNGESKIVKDRFRVKNNKSIFFWWFTYRLQRNNFINRKIGRIKIFQQNFFFNKLFRLSKYGHMWELCGRL